MNLYTVALGFALAGICCGQKIIVIPVCDSPEDIANKKLAKTLNQGVECTQAGKLTLPTIQRIEHLEQWMGDLQGDQYRQTGLVGKNITDLDKDTKTLEKRAVHLESFMRQLAAEHDAYRKRLAELLTLSDFHAERLRMHSQIIEDLNKRIEKLEEQRK